MGNAPTQWGGGEQPATLSFGIEAGLTPVSLEGGSRPANSVSLYPVALKVGYGYPISQSLALRVDALGGTMTASKGGANSSFVGGRLGAEYALNFHENNSPFVSLYAGVGYDVLLEKDSNIALPQVEMGLKVRLGGDRQTAQATEEEQRAAEQRRLAQAQAAEQERLAQQRAEEAERVAQEQQAQTEAERVAEAQRVAEAERVAEAQRVAEAERLAQEQAAVTPLIIEPTEFLGCYFPIPTTQQPLATAFVYFDAEGAPLGNYARALDGVGATLAADGTLTAVVRAYAAPVGSDDDRIALSTQYAQFVRDYLAQHFALNADQLTIKVLADCKPDTTDPKELSPEQRRLAKIIVFKNTKE